MPKDLRRYARQTNFRLVAGYFLILILIGIGSIYLIWGSSAAVSGLICIGLGLAPAVLIYILLAFLGWMAKKANEG
jgi:hypothetical protein